MALFRELTCISATQFGVGLVDTGEVAGAIPWGKENSESPIFTLPLHGTENRDRLKLRAVPMGTKPVTAACGISSIASGRLKEPDRSLVTSDPCGKLFAPSLGECRFAIGRLGVPWERGRGCIRGHG